MVLHHINQRFQYLKWYQGISENRHSVLDIVSGHTISQDNPPLTTPAPGPQSAVAVAVAVAVALLVLQECLELDTLVLELMSSSLRWYCPEAAPSL